MHQSLSLGICVIAGGLLAHATTAHAAANDTWVSGTGSNSGACPITAPCRTLAFAHNLTVSGGTIHVLSSGNFGPLIITKTISIVANGVDAMINSAVSGAGIIVHAGGTDIVSLSGLTIDQRGMANDGISFVSGRALHVQNCTLRRTVHGITFAPTGTSKLDFADSVITDPSQDGLFIHPSGSGGATVMVDRVRVENAGGWGFQFNGSNTTGSIKATVRDSVAAGGSFGILAVDQDGNGVTTLMIDHTTVANNTNIGVDSIGESSIWIGDSVVTGNGTGFSSSGGVLASYVSNKLINNTIEGTPQSSIGTQ
jgi:hypothetical protein